MAGFGLINMNGRLYDPYLQRFLSPDPFIQAPGNAQNFNRYSYCLNNPLMYTDPSGYNWSPSEAWYAAIWMSLGKPEVNFVEVYTNLTQDGWHGSSNRGGSGGGWSPNLVAKPERVYDPSTGKWQTRIGNTIYGYRWETTNYIKNNANYCVNRKVFYPISSKDGTVSYLMNYHGVNYFLVKGIPGAIAVPELGVFMGKEMYDELVINDPKQLEAITQHEYGHVLQYNSVGKDVYWGLLAPLSLASAIFHALGLNDHNAFIVEVDANNRAVEYFGSEASSLFGTSDFPTTITNNNSLLLINKTGF